jgi:hypothetical protein
MYQNIKRGKNLILNKKIEFKKDSPATEEIGQQEMGLI